MDVVYTRHAREAMAQRGVTAEQIEEVIRHPEVTYRGNGTKDHCKVHQASDIGVVVATEANQHVVITVLWRTAQTWTSQQMRGAR